MTTEIEKKAKEIYDMAWQRGCTSEIAIERIAQALTPVSITDDELEKRWPTQKEIDDAFVENNQNANSCRSWRAGIEWLREKLRGG